MTNHQPAIRVIDSAANCPELPLVEGKGNVKVVLWPGNGAEFRSIHLFSLEGGSRTVQLKHVSDCVYGIISGSGSIVNIGDGSTQPLVEGTMLHIDANDSYRIDASAEGIIFLGGPCPPDPAFYENIRYTAEVLA